MPQSRKHASAAKRQAAYRVRTEAARMAQLQSRGLPALPAIPTLPGWPRWSASVHSSTLALTTVREEMQSYFDDRTEVWQESDRGLLHEERLEALDEVLEALGELVW